MKRPIAILVALFALLALAGCGGKSQQYIDSYKQGYHLGSAFFNGGQSEANLICGPNVLGEDNDASHGYMAGCSDAANGKQAAYP
jgi:hypothetical protein